MFLTKLLLSRYRCFREPQEVALGQLTLLYGKNSSGKSALLRLPALLAHSMAGDPGLNLSDPTVHGASFQDLCWRGPELDGRGELLALGMEFESQKRWRWELEWRPPLDEGTPIVIEGPGPQGSVRLRWKPASRKEAGAERTYVLESGSAVTLRLEGLRPTAEELDLETDYLRRLAQKVMWLSANRQGPTRSGVPQGARPARKPTGADWAEAQLARDGALRGRVSQWYETHTQRRVVLDPLERNQRVRLQAVADNSPDIPFPDIGEGLQQAFPVLVALEQIRQMGGVLCIEEPESHLHPALQRALAKRVVDVLQDNPEAQVLLETHSEVFLVMALLHAVKGLRNQVRLHWIQSDRDGASTVQEILLDKAGRPRDDTLRQGFADMGVLRRELIEARRADAG